MISGHTKRAYCGVCGKETAWEYTKIHVDDSMFSPDAPHNEEVQQMEHWHCCEHRSLEDTLVRESSGELEEPLLSEDGYAQY